MLLSVLTALTFASSANDFFLRDGDRVAWYGDSITQAGNFAETVYPEWVEVYALTRYRDRNIRFANIGWPGDNTWGGEGGSSEQRVARELKPIDATVVSIMLGMNDAGYVPYDKRIDGIWQEWYGKLLGWMHEAAPKARFNLIRTSPYDDVTHDIAKVDDFTASMIRLPYNDVLLRFGEHVIRTAEKNKYAFVDFNRPVHDFLKTAKTAVSELAPKFIPDCIHPGTAGHLLMATQMIEAWHGSPLVSDVEIDARSSAVTRSIGAKVTSEKPLTWSALEASLPMPIDTHDPLIQFVDKTAHVADRISLQRLAVRGLRPGKYRLSIDGKAVATFTNRELTAGINLSAVATPMSEQANKLLDLTRKRAYVRHVRWHDIEWKLGPEVNAKAASAGLTKLEDDLRRQQLSTAKPKPHQFSLIRIS